MVRKKITVLHIIYFAKYGGAERYAHSLCTSLDADRFESQLCVLHEDDVLIQLFERSGIPVTVIGMRNGFDLRGALRFYSFIKREQCDIIHFHSPNIIAFLFALLYGRTVLYHEHSIGIHKGLKRYAIPFLLRRMQRVVAVSNFTMQNLIERMGLPAKKISVVHNGIDLKRFAITVNTAVLKNEMGFDIGKRIVGFVGRLEPVKGCDKFIEAVHYLSQQTDSFYALIFGYGSEHESLTEQIRACGLEKVVFFLDHSHAVEKYFYLFDVLVMSSVVESFGIVALEAMACAKPVIAFNVGGLPEFLTHNEEGILVAPGDTRSMAESIHRVLDNPDLVHRMGQKGYAKSRLFTMKNNAKKIEDLYLELTGA